MVYHIIGCLVVYHRSSLPEKIVKRIAPPPVAFSVIDGEDYVSVWKNMRRATRATTALAVAVLARVVI